MTYWIIPFNPNYFRMADCLREQGYVEWTQRYKYQIGDIVFIYSSKPDSKLLYKMQVRRQIYQQTNVQMTGNIC